MHIAIMLKPFINKAMKINSVFIEFWSKRYTPQHHILYTKYQRCKLQAIQWQQIPKLSLSGQVFIQINVQMFLFISVSIWNTPYNSGLTPCFRVVPNHFSVWAKSCHMCQNQTHFKSKEKLKQVISLKQLYMFATLN